MLSWQLDTHYVVSDRSCRRWCKRAGLGWFYAWFSATVLLRALGTPDAPDFLLTQGSSLADKLKDLAATGKTWDASSCATPTGTPRQPSALSRHCIGSAPLRHALRLQLPAGIPQAQRQ